MVLTKSQKIFSYFIVIATISIGYPFLSLASQSDYQETMRNNIDLIYQKLILKIDDTDTAPPDVTTESGNLNRYAQEYVTMFQSTIPVKNTLYDLQPYHSDKRNKRLDKVNSAINVITRLHAKYSQLAIKLEYKRNKLIIISAGKLIADYAALPDSAPAFLADRFMALVTGTVQFVSEGGLKTTAWSRELPEISTELDRAHKALHKTLYTEPANPDELFKLTRQGELQAERCQRLAYELQQKMRTQTRPELKAAEFKIEQYLSQIIQNVDKILATSPPIAQCIIEPVEVILNQQKPRQKITVSYLYSTGLETPAKPGNIIYKSGDASIASINQQGVVTAHKTGNTEVVAQVKGTSKLCSVPVTVTFPQAPGKQVIVPDLHWMDKPTAKKEIERAGLIASFNTAPTVSHRIPYDTVLRQRPKKDTKVTIGSTVWVTMNPQPTYPAKAKFLGIKIVKASPPYMINTEYSLHAVTANLNPNGQYIWWWYVNGEYLGNAKTMEHTFEKAGVHEVKVEMMNIVDRRESHTLKERFRIEVPPVMDYTVDFDVSPQLKKGNMYKSGDSINFTEECKDISAVTDYRWYINGSYIGSGKKISHTFSDTGNYDVTLGVRLGGNSDEGEHTKTISIGNKPISKFDPWVNRFKDNGRADNLKICSQYYIAGSQKWSQCKDFRTIGPVNGYKLCTGEQSDGWNTGFLVYSKKGSDTLNFEVYHYNFNNLKGVIRYSGRLGKSSNPVPGSLSLSCRANVADVSWTNEDGSHCSTKIWKFKSSGVLAHSGVESPSCSKATITPNRLNQCNRFAKESVNQFNENVKTCNLQGPEWHGDSERHKQWCLSVTKKEADTLIESRANTLNTCGKSWCDTYAKRAVEQNEQNIRNQCGFKGQRWSSNYENHYNWCRNTSKGAADSEIQKRDNDLKNCTSLRTGPCQQYAEKAVKQNQLNLENDCGFCGERWQSSETNHYEWCLQQPQSAQNFETKTREQLLRKCEASSSSDIKTFYDPCTNGYRLDNCLNFSSNCKKPSADRFCEDKGFTEAISWELEKVSPTYIMDDQRLCEGAYCAGFSQITCSGNKYPDNQDPVCSIKRPASGVVIPPGKAISFSVDASDPERDKLSYTWSFEGGTPAKKDKNWHGTATGIRWKNPGTYTATVLVTDDKGGSCKDTVVITVQDKDATFDCDQYADKSVQQNEKNIRNKCGLIGDLWHSNKSGHTNWCQKNGQKRATQTIELREKALNECTLAKTTTKNLACRITDPIKIAFIDAGGSVNFAGSADSPAGGTLSYDWRFGEYGALPASSKKQNPGKVKFQWAGSYLITLAVTDSAGNTCQDTRYVLVRDPNDPREFCEGYSGISMDQYKINNQSKCGFSGEHWHDNEFKHRKWCDSVTLEEARNVLTGRDEKLGQCTADSAQGIPDGNSKPTKINDGSAGTGINSKPHSNNTSNTELSINKRLISGTYKVHVKAGPGYDSQWQLTVSNGNISGLSSWNCCPGKRSDPMNGSILNNSVKITRDCTGQGYNQACLQVYTGKLKDNTIQGNFTHNGGHAGTWTMYLSDVKTGSGSISPKPLSISDWKQSKSQGGLLGWRWDEHELGWKGVWLRRGESNTFDAVWTYGSRKEKAVLTINISGNDVIVKRQQTSGFSFPGQTCTYKGTLAADNVTVTGTYGCDWAKGPFNWRATIKQATGDNSGKLTLSCADKDNEENGCCCFTGAHTYRFASRYVKNVLAQFDTGRKFNCKSKVSLEVDRGNGWQTIKAIEANSSRNGSEVAPIEISVPVNGTIQGFRISDGCVCCIDSSKITLNTGSSVSSWSGSTSGDNDDSLKSSLNPIHKLTGKWHVTQSNGYTGKLDLRQSAAGFLSGSVSWGGNFSGSVKGTVTGQHIDFTVTYAGGVTGNYKGTIAQGGTRIINGTTKGSTGATATWIAAKWPIGG